MTQATPVQKRVDAPIRPKPKGLLILMAIALLAAVAFFLWPRHKVDTMFGESRDVTETIAASGLVEGWREVAVGSSVQGTVVELYVRESDKVKKGQNIALVQDNVANAEIDQARAALQTAQAGLSQAQTGRLPSEIAGASAMVKEGRAAEMQARAAAKKARSMREQALAAVEEQRSAVLSAKDSVAQADAQLVLAQKTYDRTLKLYNEGAIAKSRLDEAEAALDVSRLQKNTAENGVKAAKAALSRLSSAVTTATDDVAVADRAIEMATARKTADEAGLSTTKAQPRSVDVELAKKRTQEAEAAVKTAQKHAENAHIVAPFDGLVVKIVAEKGASVGPAGVVSITESSRLEVNTNLDESNLGAVAVGQRAEISYSAFPDQKATAKVVRIASDVDKDRGTIKVTVVPITRPTWLRPGQTVDVNVVTAEKVKRILVPLTAIHRTDKHTAVFVIEGGVAVARPVVVGPAIGEMVPVITGLVATDRIVRDADGVLPGQRIKTP